MESQYKVCEVKLSYQPRIKSSEREKVLSSENAYEILLSVFDQETIQHKESMKTLLLNRVKEAAKLIGDHLAMTGEPYYSYGDEGRI